MGKSSPRRVQQCLILTTKKTTKKTNCPQSLCKHTKHVKSHVNGYIYKEEERNRIHSYHKTIETLYS